MKKIFIIIFCFVLCIGYAQKLKNKDGIISVEKLNYIKISEDKVTNDNYIISNLDNKELFYLKKRFFSDSSTVQYFNGVKSGGSVYFYEILSSNLEKVYFEVGLKPSMGGGWRFIEYAIKSLYNGEAINSDGTLNIEKLDILEKKVGFEFSTKEKKLKE